MARSDDCQSVRLGARVTMLLNTDNETLTFDSCCHGPSMRYLHQYVPGGIGIRNPLAASASEKLGNEFHRLLLVLGTSEALGPYFGPLPDIEYPPA